jgi:ABC-type multidrug transport system fused ATPase/permease subunit
MSTKRMGISGFLKSLVPFFKPRMFPVIIILVCMILDLAYSNVVPIMIKLLIDLAIEPGNVTMLVILLAALAGGAVIATVSALVQDVVYARTGTAVMNDIRYGIFAHLQDLPMGFYSRMQAGDIMSRFSADLESIENALIYYLPQVITSGVGMAVSVILPQLDSCHCVGRRTYHVVPACPALRKAGLGIELPTQGRYCRGFRGCAGKPVHAGGCQGLQPEGFCP